MHCFLFAFVHLGVFFLVSQTNAENAKKLLSRQKRYLVFPEGSNVQMVYCMTTGAIGRHGDLVVGLTTGLAWELPNKVDSKVKQLHRISRSILFPKIEAFLQSIGLDGKACVMKALCDAAQRNVSEVGNGSFAHELFYAMFKLPDDGTKFLSAKHQIYDDAHRTNANCAEAFPTCHHSITDFNF